MDFIADCALAVRQNDPGKASAPDHVGSYIQSYLVLAPYRLLDGRTQPAEELRNQFCAFPHLETERWSLGNSNAVVRH